MTVPYSPIKIDRNLIAESEEQGSHHLPAKRLIHSADADEDLPSATQKNRFFLKQF